MNWEFHASIRRDVPQMIEDFRNIMAEGIEEWLATHVEPMEKQEEAGISEYPSGFYHEGVSYRFRFRMGFYGKKGYVSLDSDEFDITINQTFHGGYRPSYDGLTKVAYDIDAIQQFEQRPRIRLIDNVGEIS